MMFDRAYACRASSLRTTSIRSLSAIFHLALEPMVEKMVFKVFFCFFCLNNKIYAYFESSNVWFLMFVGVLMFGITFELKLYTVIISILGL